MQASSGTDMTGKWRKGEGEMEMTAEEGMDWVKVGKENKVVTDIGGEDDPGRGALKQAMQKTERGKTADKGQYDVLGKEGDVEV